MKMTWIGGGLALAAAALIGSVATGVGRADSEPKAQTSPFSSSQEASIRAIVEEYIQDNPDVIISALNQFAEDERMQAILDAKQNAADNLSILTSDAGAYSTGASAKDAKVNVIEFFDYHCGFCKRATGLVQELAEEESDVRIVFRELPILREESELAARYSLAARKQDKYLDLHFAMMNASGVMTESRILDLAGEAGLDADQLRSDAASRAIAAEVDENIDFARSTGVDGTPTFIIASANGEFIEIIPGFSPDGIKTAIAQARKVKPSRNGSGAN